jgi:hypothetical protein
MKTLYNAQLINKELISNCNFPPTDIHQTKDEIVILKHKLEQAAKLGNIEKQKCKLYFQDNEGVKLVETTVWAACEKNIVIKYGICIPIRRIIDIEY